MREDFQDLTGSTFDRADMQGSTFNMVLLNGSRIDHSDLYRVTMRGVEIVDTTISGEIKNLVINGVDVAPLVDAELDRRHPDKPKFRPVTADGFREAWDINERLWATTVDRARKLDDELLHDSVDGEWSFVQTLRHLAFASESWVGRGILGDPYPWHPLSLPWDQMKPVDGVPHDRDARPSLDEALALRHDAMALVRRVVDELTDERLGETSDPLVGPGWPPEGARLDVRECLLVVLNEEWWHRTYAERDLGVLEQRG
jgi:uncharacterized damage-inducible protein DinB